MGKGIERIYRNVEIANKTSRTAVTFMNKLAPFAISAPAESEAASTAPLNFALAHISLEAKSAIEKIENKIKNIKRNEIVI